MQFYLNYNRKEVKKVSDLDMPNSSEIIESLSRKLERSRTLNDLKECKTLEDFQNLVKKYEALCEEDKS